MIEYNVQVDNDGNKYWYLDAKFHREDGPAVECANGTKVWYLNGYYHREDGPAVEYVNGNKYWYLNGIQYTEEGFNTKMNPTTKELTINQIEELLGYKIKVVGNG